MMILVEALVLFSPCHPQACACAIASAHAESLGLVGFMMILVEALVLFSPCHPQACACAIAPAHAESLGLTGVPDYPWLKPLFCRLPVTISP